MLAGGAEAVVLSSAQTDKQLLARGVEGLTE